MAIRTLPAVRGWGLAAFQFRRHLGTHVDFGRVLVTDRLAWEIFGAAALEKLLFLGHPSEPPPQKRAGFAGQRALSLIVLFDRLLIHEFGDGYVSLAGSGEGRNC